MSWEPNLGRVFPFASPVPNNAPSPPVAVLYFFVIRLHFFPLLCGECAAVSGREVLAKIFIFVSSGSKSLCRQHSLSKA